MRLFMCKMFNLNTSRGTKTIAYQSKSDLTIFNIPLQKKKKKFISVIWSLYAEGLKNSLCGENFTQVKRFFNSHCPFFTLV